ncbi:MAG TPA: hypothetical protein VLZ12_03295 [Verrucomicrobiae bacterium]|nr:hypothetical protein [Verrucomicrobiae bacterium]
MKKLVLLIVVFIAVVAVGLVYFTYTKPAPEAASLLPESTLLFVDVPDFPLARAQFRSTEAYALLQEPEVQNFLVAPRAALGATLGLGDLGDQQAASGGATVLHALKGELFVALIQFSASSTRVQPHFVLGADVKRGRLEATKVFGRLEHRFAVAYPGASVARKKYLGVPYAQWLLPDGHQFCHAFLNTLLVITTDEDDMRDIITRFTGPAPPDFISLGSSLKFQNARRLMPPGHMLFAYLNVDQLMGPAGKLLALAPRGASMFQGLARIQTAASSVSLAEDLVEDVGLIGYSQRDQPPSPPSRHATLALTSPETSFYSVRSVDWPTAYEEALNTLAHLGNATLSSGTAQFEQIVRDGGVHTREDLFAKLGPETAMIGRWRTGARLPDAAMVAEFDSTPESRHALDVVFGALIEAILGRHDQALWEETVYRDETLHTARIGDSSIAPTYLAVDKFLVLALTPDYARELVNQFKDGKRTLLANPAFELPMKRLPKAAATLTYCDLRTVYSQLYALAHANASTDTNQFLQLSRLPQVETIEKHLSPYMSVTVESEKNTASIALSPLGKPLTLLVGAIGAIGAAQPLLAHLPLDLIPGVPTTLSDRVVPPPPRGNQTAPSQTPTTQ